MTINGIGAIDCDVHPGVGSMRDLIPFMDELWRETTLMRGIDSLDSNSYPPGAPVTARPDWRGKGGLAAARVEDMRTQLLDPAGLDVAICNCLYGVQLLFDEYMAVAYTRALNDWVRAEWLDKEPRLRASIVVPLQNIEHAVEEIERLAPDRRFVQVLVLAMGEVPLGRRQFWPVYAAAVRHGLPVGIHAGSAYRHPVTSVGWPTYYAEDYAAQSQAFQGQLSSLITEGAFKKFPELKVVLLESGVTWLPGFLWRLSKFWRGVRAEVPWVDRPPAEIVRDQVRLTVQPFDAPDDADTVARMLDQLGSDELLLYSSDYPHWQYDGEPAAALPAGFSDALVRQIAVDNARATYPRLKEALS